MRHVVPVALAAVLAGPVAAESACVAQVHPGDWSTTLTTVASGEALISNFGAIRQSAPVSARGRAIVEGGACDGTFALRMPTMSFEMMPTGEAGGATFSGSAASGSVRYDLTITVIGPDRMVGSFEAKTGLSGAGSFMARASGLTFVHEGTPGQRPECVCRAQLEAWIAERIAQAEAYRAAWADPALRPRPAAWPAQSVFLDYWGPRAHRRMIDMVVAGYDPDRAAEVIWNNTSSSGDPIENDFSVADRLGGQDAGATAAAGQLQADEEYESVTAAYVDDACEIHVGDAHRAECYPDIALAATIVHESVHVAQCEARLPIGGLDGQADREVEAYTAEAAFWRNWIPENCD